MLSIHQIKREMLVSNTLKCTHTRILVYWIRVSMTPEKLFNKNAIAMLWYFALNLPFHIHIWSTFSRNDTPCKIFWWFPKTVYILVFPGELDFTAIEMGPVFFNLYTSLWLDPKKIVGGFPENCLNECVFWSMM